MRLIFFTLWKAILAALLAALLARVDAYVESSGKLDSPAGRAWELYRRRQGKKVRRGTPPGAARAIDTQGRPKP